MMLIMLPFVQGAGVYWLQNLRQAGRLYDPFVFVEFHAAIIPGQTTIIDEVAYDLLRVLGKVLIFDRFKGCCRKSSGPVLHQAGIIIIIVTKLG